MKASTQTLKKQEPLKIAHKALTILLVLDVMLAGLVFLASSLTEVPQITETFLRLGYPLYLVPLLGVIKLAAVVALHKGKVWR